jgi:peptide-methionine (S)-S-oxide reductase
MAGGGAWRNLAIASRPAEQLGGLQSPALASAGPGCYAGPVSEVRPPVRLTAKPTPQDIRMNRILLATAGLAFAAWSFLGTGMAAEKAVQLPPPAQDARSTAATETAVFAGGCFWGVQAVFQHTQGVLNAVSGYAGGDKGTAKYDLIGSGRTGHAESVEVTYDPKLVSYGTLLRIYFSVAHDPTTLNRQGPDRGTQYRSALFVRDAQQKDVAEKYIAQLTAAKAFPSPIVTQVTPLVAFYPAEAYHQDYATLHPTQPYIATFDLPKIANLKATLPQLYREQPVLVAGQARS